MSRSALLVSLAVAGLVISLDLAAFQLGFLGSPWEPLFGDGSRRVLTSDLSRMLPIPDAAAGAGAYLVEALLGGILLVRRRGAVRVATTLAVIASIGAAVGAFLVAYQVIVVGAACTLCITSAALSWLLAGGALMEAHERRGARAPWPDRGEAHRRPLANRTDRNKESVRP